MESFCSISETCLITVTYITYEINVCSAEYLLFYLGITEKNPHSIIHFNV